MASRDIHRNLTRVLAVVMLLIGVAMITTFVLGDASSSKVVIGMIFVAAGAGRLVVERRRSGSS